MGLAFVNGFSARCSDCVFFEPTGKRSTDDWSDGRCTNTRHVKTHGGVDRTNSRMHTCFDAERANGQMNLFEEVNHE